MRPFVGSDDDGDGDGEDDDDDDDDDNNICCPFEDIFTIVFLLYSW